MENYIEIDGKYYALDLERMMSFINKDKSVMQTISQSYNVSNDHVGDTCVQLSGKDVSETTDNVSEVISNYRFTILSSLMNLLFVPISDGTGNIITTESVQHMHLGQKFVFNTLVEMGIIYEIDAEE